MPLLAYIVTIACDNCIVYNNPKHHLAPYLEKIENLFKLLNLVKKDWSTIPMGSETERKRILDIVGETEVQLIKFRNRLTIIK